jgi:hypothetical protein
MKRMIALLVVLLVAFALVIPASAKGNGPGGDRNGNPGTGTGAGQTGKKNVFALSGTITGLGTNSVTIEIVGANKLVQASPGTQITVTVTPLTRYLLRDGTTATSILFTDLAVGQPVSIQGVLIDNTWTASRITVGALLSCFQ